MSSYDPSLNALAVLQLRYYSDLLVTLPFVHFEMNVFKPQHWCFQENLGYLFSNVSEIRLKQNNNNNQVFPYKQPTKSTWNDAIVHNWLYRLQWQDSTELEHVWFYSLISTWVFIRRSILLECQWLRGQMHDLYFEGLLVVKDGWKAAAEMLHALFITHLVIWFYVVTSDDRRSRYTNIYTDVSIWQEMLCKHNAMISRHSYQYFNL